MSNDTEMTTLVDKTELRNRFTPQTTEEEKEQPQETQEQETQEKETQEQETQEQEAQEAQEAQESNTEEEKEAVDTPSESDVPVPLPKDKYGREYVEANGKRYYAPLVIREDEYGRKYVYVQEEKFYAEEPSWNTPFPVALSISLILGINLLNIGYALSYLYVC